MLNLTQFRKQPQLTIGQKPVYSIQELCQVSVDDLFDEIRKEKDGWLTLRHLVVFINYLEVTKERDEMAKWLTLESVPRFITKEEKAGLALLRRYINTFFNNRRLSLLRGREFAYADCIEFIDGKPIRNLDDFLDVLKFDALNFVSTDIYRDIVLRNFFDLVRFYAKRFDAGRKTGQEEEALTVVSNQLKIVSHFFPWFKPTERAMLRLQSLSGRERGATMTWGDLLELQLCMEGEDGSKTE